MSVWGPKLPVLNHPNGSQTIPNGCPAQLALTDLPQVRLYRQAQLQPRDEVRPMTGHDSKFKFVLQLF